MNQLTDAQVEFIEQRIDDLHSDEVMTVDEYDELFEHNKTELMNDFIF